MSCCHVTRTICETWRNFSNAGGENLIQLMSALRGGITQNDFFMNWLNLSYVIITTTKIRQKEKKKSIDIRLFFSFFF